MATTPTRAPRLSIAPLTHPRYGQAELEADLAATIRSALEGVLHPDVAADQASEPLHTVLARLADDRMVLTPAAVLTLVTDGISDAELARLRAEIFESGCRRMRVSAAIGALLGLRHLG